MTTQTLQDIAAEVVIPDGATDLKIVADHTPGRRLADGTWAGDGGTTKFGPAWMIRGGLETSPPVALLDTVREASELYSMLVGPEGELGMIEVPAKCVRSVLHVS